MRGRGRARPGWWSVVDAAERHARRQAACAVQKRERDIIPSLA